MFYLFRSVLVAMSLWQAYMAFLSEVLIYVKSVLEALVLIYPYLLQLVMRILIDQKEMFR